MKVFQLSLISIICFSFSLLGIIWITNKPAIQPSSADNGMGGGDSAPPFELPDEPYKEIRHSELFYRTYTVKAGDMVGTIAADYKISQDAIISLNKLRNTRAIQIGQILKIPSIDGISYTVKSGETPEEIADRYKISLEKIARINKLTDNKIEASAVIFLPDAKLDWATLQEINGDLFKIPLHSSYYITSRYGWRDNPFMPGTRSFHNGIDLAAPKGTPVYAALSGKVIATGYSTVYGNYVMIKHHAGYQTLYGHLSSILTSKDSFVSPSTKIGTVGSTGMSTGAHLHFTVYKNGAATNPAALWS